jgi:hypothetical protein
MHQVSFTAFAQQMVCAPSATQTDEVQAVAAPASSGSRVRTRRPKRVHEVFHGSKWLATYLTRSPAVAIIWCLRDCAKPGVSAYAAALRACDLRVEVRES